MRNITLPILNTEYKVYVVIGTVAEGNKSAQRYFGAKETFIEDMNRGKTIYRAGHHPLVWISRQLKGREFTATLAHEAIHAVMFIMDYLSMTPEDKSGDEFLAHSVAAIIRNVNYEGRK